jgi:hypothetical protein
LAILCQILRKDHPLNQLMFTLSLGARSQAFIMTGKSNIKNLSTIDNPNKSFVSGGPQKARLLPESTASENIDLCKAWFGSLSVICESEFYYVHEHTGLTDSIPVDLEQIVSSVCWQLQRG